MALPEPPRLSGGAPEPAVSPVAAEDAALRRADTRVRAVDRVRALVAEGLSAGRAAAIAADEVGVSTVTVQRWRRRDRGDGRIAAQMDRPGRGRRQSIADPDMIAVIEDHLYARGRRVGAAYLRTVLLNRFGPGAPTERTLARWIARWRREHAREARIVGEPDKARGRLMPAVGDAGGGAAGPNSVWEIDSTTADVMCVNGRRPTLLACVDVWTRRARVLVAPTSRADAVCALVRRCVLDWGVPASVRTDRGSDYTSERLTRALADLAIEQRLCAPYQPYRKPFVERFFGTLTGGCLAHLPGYVGRSPAEGSAIRDRLSFAGRRGRRPAEVYAAEFDREGLQAVVDAWCDDVYGWRPHAGLGGVAPHARAAEWTAPLRRVEDERALDLLLTAPGGAAVRTVQKGCVHVDRGRYAAPELAALGGERVIVRRDGFDLGRVLVFAAPDRGGAFVCEAVDLARAGVDRAALAGRAQAGWRRTAQDARAGAREAAARGGAARSIFEHVIEPAARRAKKVVALPRQSASHRTPALDAAADAAAAREREAAARERKAAVNDGPRRRRLSDAVQKILERE